MLTRRKMSAWLIVALVLPLFGSIPMHAQKALPPPVELSSGWQLQDAAKVSDAGAAISSETFQPTGWLAATVPGTVLTSMVNDGIYPEPLYGENSRPIPESLNKTSYWYRTTFSVPKNYAHRQVALHFDGANFRSEGLGQWYPRWYHSRRLYSRTIRRYEACEGRRDSRFGSAGISATASRSSTPTHHRQWSRPERWHHGDRWPHISIDHRMGLAAFRRRPRYRPMAESLALRLRARAD